MKKIITVVLILSILVSALGAVTLTAQALYICDNHEMGTPIYTWINGYYCDANSQCIHCDYWEGATKSGIFSVVTDATCTQKGTGVYTVTFYNTLFETQQLYVDIDPLGHDFAAAWTSDANTHWYACSRCEVRKDEAAHTPLAAVVENNTDPTCTQAGAYESVVYCAECGGEISRTPVNVTEQGHDFVSAWTSDATHHWHTCSRCDAVDSKAEHTWDEGTVTTAPTSTEQGEKLFTCTVCTAEKTEVLPAVPEYTADNLSDLEWTQGSEEGLELTIHRSLDDALTFEKFEGITVDGVAVGAENFDAASGSLLLTIKAAFLNTLTVGEHALSVRFSDGAAQVSVRVLEAPQEEEPAQAEDAVDTELTDTEQAPEVVAENPAAAGDSVPSPATGDTVTAVMFTAILAAGIGIAAVSKRKKED